MKQNLESANELIATFAQQRQVLLRHTAEVLCPEPSRSASKPSSREAQLSAILVSSLEELKVAEEELTERIAVLAELRDDLERRVRGARQLFDLAPACLLVSDVQGQILDANRSCQMMLKRDSPMLERQPLARFIPSDERRSFRDGLARILSTEGVSDWRFVLSRPTDAPVPVTAAVRVVRPTELHTLLSTESTGALPRFPGWLDFTTPTFTIDADGLLSVEAREETFRRCGKVDCRRSALEERRGRRLLLEAARTNGKTWYTRRDRPS